MNCNCSYILLTVLSWPSDNKKKFGFRIQAAIFPTVYHTQWLHSAYYPFLLLNVKQESCEYKFFIILGLPRLSAISAAGAPSARPLLDF